MKVSDIYKAVDAIAPFDSACAWDNCGLMCGDMNAEVEKVLVTLDADMYALKSARACGCQLVISHHPLVFSALKSVTADTTVYSYVREGIAVISAHTCLDMASGGINDLLAGLAGLENVRSMCDDGYPLGRYGNVPQPDLLVQRLKQALPSDSAHCLITSPIKTAAVVSGSGGSMLPLLGKYGCDTLITGECKHDGLVYAADRGLNVITLGHFETENIIVKPLARRLSQMLPDVCFIPSDRQRIAVWR